MSHASNGADASSLRPVAAVPATAHAAINAANPAAVCVSLRSKCGEASHQDHRHMCQCCRQEYDDGLLEDGVCGTCITWGYPRRSRGQDCLLHGSATCDCDRSSAASSRSNDSHPHEPEPIPRLSLQLCCVLFSYHSSAIILRAAAAFYVPHAPTSNYLLPCSLSIYDVTMTRAERLRWTIGSGLGLVAARIMHATACRPMGRALSSMATAIVRRVTAVLAAATPEGMFAEGGRLYVAGRYVDAVHLLSKAVQHQHARAHAILSNILVDGKPGVPMDHGRAFEVAAAGARLDCVHSKGALARCLIGGLGVERDEARGFRLGMESAAAGSCYGQYVVGRCFHFGFGVEVDMVESVRFFRPAARQGHAAALCHLGVMLDRGEVLPQDKAQAARFFLLSAEQGDSLALYNLGVMFHSGQGVAMDHAEALRLFRLAAEQGDAAAQFSIGTMYKKGHGVESDTAEAIRWFRLAAENGDARARAQLKAHDRH